jgi:hypothetical protein
MCLQEYDFLVPRPWPIFFGFVAVVIVTTMLAPRVFGFQQFTQWGGMYIDSWCVTNVSSDLRTSQLQPPADPSQVDRLLAGDGRTSPIVWYAPMHNEVTCVAWARNLCGKQVPGEAWRMRTVFASFREKDLAHGANVCLLPEDPSFSWFAR